MSNLHNLHIDSFFNSRSNDVEQLSIISSKNNKTSLISIAKVGKGKLKRTTSYRPYKIPQKSIHIKKLKNSSHVNNKKRRKFNDNINIKKYRNREHNRRPSILLNNKNNILLPTHFWLVKRMKMIIRWQRKIPLFHLQKGIKWSLRALQDRAVINDESYHVILQLSALQKEDIVKLLESMVVVRGGSGYNNKSLFHNEDDYLLNGIFDLNIHLYKNTKTRSTSSQEYLGPAVLRFLPRSKFSSQKSRAWLWVHPAMVSQVISFLSDISLPSVEVRKISHIAKFRICGRGALKILARVFNITNNNITNNNNKMSDEYQNKNRDTSLPFFNAYSECEAPDRVWPIGRCLSLDVLDPRHLSPSHYYNYKGKLTFKANAECKKPQYERKSHRPLLWPRPNVNNSNNNRNNNDDDNDNDRSNCGYSSALYTDDDEDGDVSSDFESNRHNRYHFIPDHEINAERCAARFKHFQLGNDTTIPIATTSSCANNNMKEKKFVPVVITRTANHQAPSFEFERIRKSEINSAWRDEYTLILPTEWARVMWVALTLAGAHAIGLKEEEMIATVKGQPNFPRDYVDTMAGRNYWMRETEEAWRQDQKRPPKKRLGVSKKLPFWYIDQGIHQVDAEDMKVDVIVENVSMDLDREIGTNMTLENAVDTSEETSILSSISPYILRDSDLIYASPPPPASISSSVSGSNSSNGSSSNGANCMPLALVRMKATMRGVPTRGASVYIPVAEDLLSYHQSKTWLGLQINKKTMKRMTPTDRSINPVNIGGREFLGKVTDGVYVPGSHIGTTAVATVACNATILKKIVRTKPERQQQCLVMFHNPRSEWLRPALITIIVD